jgi:hypothetical protein
VYNLRPDSAGICHYRVEYSLYPEGAAERRTLFVRDFESVQQETFQAGTIPATAISSGSYILEALTTDLLAHVTRTALARFRVD